MVSVRAGKRGSSCEGKQPMDRAPKLGVEVIGAYIPATSFSSVMMGDFYLQNMDYGIRYEVWCWRRVWWEWMGGAVFVFVGSSRQLDAEFCSSAREEGPGRAKSIAAHARPGGMTDVAWPEKSLRSTPCMGMAGLDSGQAVTGTQLNPALVVINPGAGQICVGIARIA